MIQSSSVGLDRADQAVDTQNSAAQTNGFIDVEFHRQTSILFRRFSTDDCALAGQIALAADPLNPCRVVFCELSGDSNRAAFAYGTLRGHAERGEERFAVRFDPASNEVLYSIAAFSRPASLFSKLGYPFARSLQKRFAVSSADALARAVA